jgi:hypothetical protein
MVEVTVWIGWGLAALLILFVAWIGVKGFGLLQLFQFNRAQLKKLARNHEAVADPVMKKSLAAVIGPCSLLNSRWVLREDDLYVGKNTQQMVTAVALACHPKSPLPVGEARIGKLLSACIEVKDTVNVLTQNPGIHLLTKFRLRHVLVLAKAWKKKEAWERSPAGRAVARLKVIPVIRWVYYSIRFMDVGFWAARMSRHLVYNFAFKIILVRWYLLVGDLALKIYVEGKSSEATPNENSFSELEGLPEQDVPGELSEPVRALVAESRKAILFNIGALEQKEVTAIYMGLVRAIARHHHSESNAPLYEACLYDLMLGVVRLADWVGSIRSLPVFNKLLDLRVSHFLTVKNAAGYLKDSQVLDWFQKYKLGQVFRFSNLLHKVVLKRHPGVLLKDLTWTLAKEGGKRWVWIYLHDKIALETYLIYKGEGDCK